MRKRLNIPNKVPKVTNRTETGEFHNNQAKTIKRQTAVYKSLQRKMTLQHEPHQALIKKLDTFQRRTS